MSFDPIGAAYIASKRPIYVQSAKFRSTVLWYYNRGANQATNVLLYTDALTREHAIAASRTANMNHIAGIGGTAIAQQAAVMNVFILDFPSGVEGFDVLEAYSRGYDKYTNFCSVTPRSSPTTSTPKAPRPSFVPVGEKGSHVLCACHPSDIDRDHARWRNSAGAPSWKRCSASFSRLLVACRNQARTFTPGASAIP